MTSLRLFALTLCILTCATAAPVPQQPSVFHQLANAPLPSSIAAPLNPKALDEAAFPQSPTSPFALSTNLRSTAPLANGTSVPFFLCPSTSPAGVVHSVVISDCSRSGEDEPCHFREGEKYLVQLNYTTYLDAELPRAGLEARDDTVDPSESYAYSGQSWDGCKYTACPVKAAQSTLYTYEFKTLQSPFDYLTFNLTQSMDGPSLFCAGFPVAFVAKDAGEGETWASVEAAAPTTTTSSSSETADAVTLATSASRRA